MPRKQHGQSVQRLCHFIQKIINSVHGCYSTNCKSGGSRTMNYSTRRNWDIQICAMITLMVTLDCTTGLLKKTQHIVITTF